MKWLVTALIILLALLQYKLWFAEGNVLAVYQLRQELQLQRDLNDQLRQQNAALDAEVFDLKQGTQSVEERARSEMGMIHQDEQFYQLVEKQ